MRIRYTAEDVETFNNSGKQNHETLHETLTKNDYGYTLVAPTSRPEIEGRIICDDFNVQLHVIEKHIVEGETIS